MLHASLLSDIRGHPDQSLLFNYNNLQHLRGHHPELSRRLVVGLPQTLMRLEQGGARIWTHIIKMTPLDDGGHKINSSYIFHVKDINREISTACKRFIDSLYSRSDHAHFIGSFVDAYDIFISSIFYIQLEQRHCHDMRSDPYAGTHSGGQELRYGMINDVVNKACTLIAGIESRFGTVKAFRRVLREFFVLATGQSHPDGIQPVSFACAEETLSVVICVLHLKLTTLTVFVEFAGYCAPTNHLHNTGHTRQGEDKTDAKPSLIRM